MDMSNTAVSSSPIITTQCADEQSKKKCRRQRKDLYRLKMYGLEIPNLHCLKSYKIRNTFTNFETYLFVEL